MSFGHWDGLRKGLLSGERLQLDLDRMDAAYVERNRREYEITKHISLERLDPMALAKLRLDGNCFFSIPEALLDQDFPGHYFRRIRSVTVTIPSVAGPQVGLPAKLTQVSSQIRVQPTGPYDYETATGLRELTGIGESIVTSSAQADSGVFSGAKAAMTDICPSRAPGWSATGDSSSPVRCPR